MNLAPISLAQLNSRHPDYNGGRLSRLEALYKGGDYIFGNREIVADLFPKHRRETDSVYAERVKRAFYLPYAGEIIDHLIASLFQNKIRMDLCDGSESTDYYKNILDDISPAGGDKCSLAELLKEQVLTCFTKRVAYTLIDLPASDQFENRAQQESAGALDAYAVSVCPESVLDWEESANGALIWACIYSESRPRSHPHASRDVTVKSWTFYTKDSWWRHELHCKAGDETKQDEMIPVVASGVHSFGIVPLIRMRFSDGLWAMSKLEGPAKELLNKASALAWAQYQHLFPELYEFEYRGDDGSCGVEIGGQQSDGSAALTAKRGQGFIQIRDARARAEFVGPDTSGFAHASQHIANIRDEMHRVCHQMALTLDNNSASLRRSADSKAHDKASQSVILEAVGQIVRSHAETIFNTISVGRGEQLKWKASGMDAYDAVDVAGVISEAVELEAVSIKSKTFHVKHKIGVARAVLGESVSEDVYEKIEKELEANVEGEQNYSVDLQLDEAALAS